MTEQWLYEYDKSFHTQTLEDGWFTDTLSLAKHSSLVYMYCDSVINTGGLILLHSTITLHYTPIH